MMLIMFLKNLLNQKLF